MVCRHVQMWTTCTKEKKFCNLKQRLKMSYAPQTHIGENRLSSRVFALFGSVHTNLVLVMLTWFSPACDFGPLHYHTHASGYEQESDCWFIPVWVHGNLEAAVSTYWFVIPVLQQTSYAQAFSQQDGLTLISPCRKTVTAHHLVCQIYHHELMMHTVGLKRCLMFLSGQDPSTGSAYLCANFHP